MCILFPLISLLKKNANQLFFSSALKSNPRSAIVSTNYAARVEYKLPIKYLILCLYSYHIIRSEVSRRHHSQSTGPKPSVDIQRLEPCSITAFNFGITQSTGGVNILNIAGLHEAFDEVLFSSRFETDHVHAHFSAVITAGEPIPSGVSKSCFVTGPRDPIAFAAKCKMTGCKCKRSIEKKIITISAFTKKKKKLTKVIFATILSHHHILFLSLIIRKKAFFFM